MLSYPSRTVCFASALFDILIVLAPYGEIAICLLKELWLFSTCSALSPQVAFFIGLNIMEIKLLTQLVASFM